MSLERAQTRVILSTTYPPHGGTSPFASRSSVKPDRSSLGSTALYVAVCLQPHVRHHTLATAQLGGVASLRGLSTLMLRLVVVPL